MSFFQISFVILFGMREKIAYFKLCVTPVLTQNPDISNFHDPRTLNNEKLIGYFGSPWYSIVSKWISFLFNVA